MMMMIHIPVFFKFNYSFKDSVRSFYCHLTNVYAALKRREHNGAEIRDKKDRIKTHNDDTS